MKLLTLSRACFAEPFQQRSFRLLAGHRETFAFSLNKNGVDLYPIRLGPTS